MKKPARLLTKPHTPTPHLSICIPSNRAGVSTIGRLAQAAGWARQELEVVIRDNSGDKQKAELLAALPLNGIQKPWVKVVTAEPCRGLENFTQSLKASRGVFAMLLQDDDVGIDWGVQVLMENACAARQEKIDDAVGLTGRYFIDSETGESIAAYQGLYNAQPFHRLASYLAYQGPNMLLFSAVRRELAVSALEFVSSMPLEFSFHDQLICLIWLLAGRFRESPRTVLINDNSHWATAESAVFKDAEIYARAGVDPAFRKLHWMVCGIEGAWIVLKSRFSAHLSDEDKDACGGAWMETMFRRFMGDEIGVESQCSAHADRLKDKWRAQWPNFDLEVCLGEVAELIAVTSPGKATEYAAFWKQVADDAP